MGVNRRQWLNFVGRLLAVAAGPAIWLFRRASPRRYVQAIRCGTYPGPRKRLAEDDINGPASWGG